MLNHAGRTYLPMFQDQLRTSVLGRAMGRKMRDLQQPGAADEDDAKPSPATDGHVRKFFDAWHTGDDAAQSDALNKIVQTWRADNAAGGVPVHAHLPLPTSFAQRLVQSWGDAQTLDEVSARLDPSVRSLVEHQLAHLTRPTPKSGEPARGGVSNEAEYRADVAGATRGLSDLLGSRSTAHQALESEDRLQRSLGESGSLSRSSEGGRLILNGRRVQSVVPLSGPGDGVVNAFSQPGPFGPPWPGDSSEGGEAGPGQTSPAQPRQKPSPYGSPPNPTPKPPAPPPRVPHPGHRPGEWQRQPDPRTSNGSRLVSHTALSQKQQDNLRNRNWVHPTGEYPGNERLLRGWGYFGAERSGTGGVSYHGGYDAPGDEVVLPTRAKFVGYDPDTQILTFDLGDGLVLQLVHVNPTPQMLRMRPGANLDAGWPLGRVDSQQDHAHIQIRATEPGGDKWVVDPTPYMEKRARTFWRQPMNDTLDTLIDIFASESIP